MARKLYEIRNATATTSASINTYAWTMLPLPPEIARHGGVQGIEAMMDDMVEWS
uniref:Uncharacterized protein n=1 Tax=Arundo donax TaxID=35708 RepID=A0A0A9GQA3_ARUDO